MRLDLYQAETARTAAAQAAIFQAARDILQGGRPLTVLEMAGLLHALQVSVENAIGKAKHWLKATGAVVPVSAYDAFSALVEAGLLPAQNLPTWNALIGLRNRIVHDYMNINLQLIETMVLQRREQFVLDFLLLDLPYTPRP